MTARALVLGAGGFLGSHLTRRLIDDGWDVIGVVRDTQAPYVFDRLGAHIDDVELVAGDIGDAQLLERVVAGVDAVFAFAGHSGAARSLDEPFDDLVVNAGGQLALLESLRTRNASARVVFPGSRLQYGRPERLPVDEEHPQRPTSLYGLHKSIGEQYHRLYHDLYGIPTTCLRISNPYGPRQDRPDRAFGLVGNFLATAAGDGDIELYGGGEQLRDYVFVDDLIDLCVACATNPRAIGRVYNAGGPASMPIRAMADAVVETVGRGRVVSVPWPPVEAAVETGAYVGDIRRADDELGWRPSVDLATGLELTWAAFGPAVSARR